MKIEAIPAAAMFIGLILSANRHGQRHKSIVIDGLPDMPGRTRGGGQIAKPAPRETGEIELIFFSAVSGVTEGRSFNFDISAQARISGCCKHISCVGVCPVVAATAAAAGSTIVVEVVAVGTALVIVTCWTEFVTTGGKLEFAPGATVETFRANV